MRERVKWGNIKERYKWFEEQRRITHRDVMLKNDTKDEEDSEKIYWKLNTKYTKKQSNRVKNLEEEKIWRY